MHNQGVHGSIPLIIVKRHHARLAPIQKPIHFGPARYAACHVLAAVLGVTDHDNALEISIECLLQNAIGRHVEPGDDGQLDYVVGHIVRLTGFCFLLVRCRIAADASNTLGFFMTLPSLVTLKVLESFIDFDFP